METPDHVAVTIDSIRKHPDSEHWVVVLRTSEDRILPIYIGPFEADAIAMILQGRQTERPMTHDLTVRLLETLAAQVQHVIVNKFIDNTFFAEITLDQGEQHHQIDARPSDAFALAVRTNTPIFVARSVLDAVGGPDDVEYWAKMADRVREHHQRMAHESEAAGEQPEAQ
jgi:bifunctional DNase/RNase